MRAERLVIRNGFVVSMDPEIGEIPAADVLVEDGKIVDIGQALDVADAEEIDATQHDRHAGVRRHAPHTSGRRPCAASCPAARSTTTSP